MKDLFEYSPFNSLNLGFINGPHITLDPDAILNEITEETINFLWM